jgi:plastocyanin
MNNHYIKSPQDGALSKEHNKTVWLIAGLATLVIAAWALYALNASTRGTAEVSAPSGQEEATGIPPYTEEIEAMLAESDGFEVLISYTDNGFEPSSFAIEVGDTVRFTNNSSGDLWITAVGTDEHPSYPGASACGTSALDTCKPLEPREFWEFTFNSAGVWEYVNYIDNEKTGAIEVR